MPGRILRMPRQVYRFISVKVVSDRHVIIAGYMS